MTPNNEIILRNEGVKRVSKAKFIGVIADQHLNWKDRITMISLKCSKSCKIIGFVILKILNRGTLFTIVSCIPT